MKCKFCGHKFNTRERYYGHYYGASTTTVCVHRKLEKYDCPKCYKDNSKEDEK